MPHLILEYSQNIATKVRAAQLMQIGHEIMIASGMFTTSDIKTRAYALEEYRVGEQGSVGSFIHATVRLLEGRTVDQRKALSEPLFEAIANTLPEETQVTVEIVEMNRDTYKKRQKS